MGEEPQKLGLGAGTQRCHSYPSPAPILPGPTHHPWVQLTPAPRAVRARRDIRHLQYHPGDKRRPRAGSQGVEPETAPWEQASRRLTCCCAALGEGDLSPYATQWMATQAPKGDVNNLERDPRLLGSTGVLGSGREKGSRNKPSSLQ